MIPARPFLATLVVLAALGAGCSGRDQDASRSGTEESGNGGSAAPRRGETSPASDRGDRRPNLLLVTLDTTRADHLGCYGGKYVETPRLDGLAGEGLLVEQAMAVAPLTLPSHASILTGLYPPRHGVRDNSDFRLPDSETTLAEHLRSLGYATEAVVGSFVLSSALGLQQGFDGYDEPREQPASRAADRVRFKAPLERRASEITDAAIAALERVKGKPFFLWAHYYDPHQPYAPPAPYTDRFVAHPYDGEIAYADAQLGRLFDDLARRGLLDGTLVVVTADHGESLGDHGEETHGIFVYDATIHVPLLLRLPGSIPAGKRARAVVSGVDIVPTVLDLMGLPPLAGVQGTSFAASARGGEEAPRDAVYAEAIYAERVYGWAPTFALRDNKTKFIEAPEPELYALPTDPGERENLAPSRSEEVKLWRDRLESRVRSFGSADAASLSPMDQETRERLASLGYVSGGSGATGRVSRPDPKRLAAVNEKFVRATTYVSEGRPVEALLFLKEALDADPENPAVLSLSGDAQVLVGGKREQGLTELQAAARLAPGVYDNQWNLANALFLSGKLPDAVHAYRAALAVQPHSVDARYGLGRALHAMNDAPGAVREYREAIRLGLGKPKIHAGLGLALAAVGDRAGAESELRSAVAADPSLAEAWNKLGILAAQAGNNGQARDFFAGALTAEPDNPDALYNHAKASMLVKDFKTAEQDVARLSAKHPRFPSLWYLKAHILIAAGDRDGARAVVKGFLAQPQGADPGLVQTAKDLLQKLGG